MKSPTNNPLDVVRGREQEIGPFLGIVVILVLLVIGALYFWLHELNVAAKRSSAATTTEVIVRTHPPAATSTETAAASNENAELDAIESNLESQTKNVSGLNF